MADHRRTAEVLVADWQSGVDQDECFRQLYERHARAVAYFFANQGLTTEECRDLTQETFVLVLRGLPKFRSEAQFSTWLRRIVQSVWLNWLRDRGRLKRKGSEVSLDGRGEEAADITAGHLRSTGNDREPLHNVLRAEKHRRLRQAVESLPPDQKALLLLRVDREMKYREIAKTMRLPVGTVKSRLSKARRHLREILDSHYADISL